MNGFKPYFNNLIAYKMLQKHGELIFHREFPRFDIKLQFFILPSIDDRKLAIIALLIGDKREFFTEKEPSEKVIIKNLNFMREGLKKVKNKFEY
jgi:hypothetical protein